MKATLEFSLPEEDETYQIYLKALDMHSALWDYQNWLRSICKYGDPGEHDAEKCREKLFEVLKEHNVDL
jgi:hypothetical protein